MNIDVRFKVGRLLSKISNCWKKPDLPNDVTILIIRDILLRYSYGKVVESLPWKRQTRLEHYIINEVTKLAFLITIQNVFCTDNILFSGYIDKITVGNLFDMINEKKSTSTCDSINKLNIKFLEAIIAILQRYDILVYEKEITIILSYIDKLCKSVKVRDFWSNYWYEKEGRSIAVVRRWDGTELKMYIRNHHGEETLVQYD